MQEATTTVFDVHQWIIPATTCDYPVLAVARDQSAMISLGNDCLGFDWGIPEEARPWLAEEFAPTGQTLCCDVATVRHLLTATFFGGTEFGIVRFDDERRPITLELALVAQQEAEQAAEYLIHAVGKYQRFYRASEEFAPVTATERAMLDVCVATFTELAERYAAWLRQPPPPRYRSSWCLASAVGH